jgi:hypothetical protein
MPKESNNCQQPTVAIYSQAQRITRRRTAQEERQRGVAAANSRDLSSKLKRNSCLGEVKEFGVSQNILEKVYVSLIESILVFNISVWFGHLTLINKISWPG